MGVWLPSVRRLRSGDLAVSTLTIYRAVRNIMRLVRILLQKAVKMATMNPVVVLTLKETREALSLAKTLTL